jgi:hypothetical protein
MKANLHKYGFLLLFFAIILSCNAPRNNPLDPENPNSKVGIIEGYVQTIRVPHLPISNTEIFWANDGIITETDNNGYFKIEGVNRNSGWIYFSNPQYSNDSVFIDLENNNKFSDIIFLNSIPKIDDLKFYSVTRHDFPDKQKYNLEVSVKITDEENDVDSVFISNAELNTNLNLLYNASTRYYNTTIKLEDLNLISIDAVIGKAFEISVIDRDTNRFVIGQSNIKRIIKEEIETKEPKGRDTIETSSPVLSWNRFKPGFDYRYMLEIYTEEVPAVLLWQQEISSEEIQFEATVNLTSGDYFWVNWAIDEFDNRTRSKPSSFIVK